MEARDRALGLGGQHVATFWGGHDPGLLYVRDTKKLTCSKTRKGMSSPWRDQT